MEDRLGLSGHRCPGCGTSLPEWRPVCEKCAERNRRQEEEAWEEWQDDLARAAEEEMTEVVPEHPGPDAGAEGKTRRGDVHEKA